MPQSLSLLIFLALSLIHTHQRLYTSAHISLIAPRMSCWSFPDFPPLTLSAPSLLTPWSTETCLFTSVPQWRTFPTHRKRRELSWSWRVKGGHTLYSKHCVHFPLMGGQRSAGVTIPSVSSALTSPLSFTGSCCPYCPHALKYGSKQLKRFKGITPLCSNTHSDKRAPAHTLHRHTEVCDLSCDCMISVYFASPFDNVTAAADLLNFDLSTCRPVYRRG